MATNEQRREAAKRKLAAQQAHRAERAEKRKRTTTIAAVATVLVVALAAGGVYALTAAWGGPEEAAPPAQAQGDGPDTSGLPTVPLPQRPTALPASVDCAYAASPEPASKPATPPPGGQVSAEGQVPTTLQTSAGTIDLTLDRALAPCTVNSFANLAQQGYFDGTSCHRLTTSPGLQVLQCGDPTGRGSGGPGYSFADEVFPELTYGRGLLAMANAGPDTNGSQFFMIYGDAQLPPNYTVFGSIGPQGLSTLDTVAKGGESVGSGDGTPNVPVEIQGATVG
ncbi:peptidylprolyl isomerase [Pseudonocardia sp. EC080610-09]|uniref:peptidylprolyl isomerase n=1 Tax=unclassified Pseudonocardia TaxID=2619320 RepID=UPI0006CB2B57|nr:MULTISPECIES: peptidylprolyl isomerase [unclassified Pseudonocardia]ALE73198.1 peptidylprolyl isomerase [Pseudonocardia sp. EC080625-04]ALL76529.1 peptidylprolyl isomerase [Pseudonocardia sp. EC080610-09]ALL83555.1 peptidylprolyl isomerase [Pseudonocardia sp. EC080619-01]